MKRFLIIISVVIFILLQSCTSTRRFGTTIERDENNPCQVNLVIQVAIQGTAEDVKTVRSALEECYNQECFIPCDTDSSKGCMTKITVVVKRFAELNEDERSAFHYVEMVNDDGLPSNAYLGTPNSGAVSGTWRRNQPAAVYCHEVLHFCGLPDKYCSRLYDPVTGAVTVERNCDPPPEPSGGSCCAPTASHTRCSTPCDGHHDDLMGTVSASLSCENIRDVLKGAGLDNCPQECCVTDQTFTRPPPELHVVPGYYHFGDKNLKFGSIGVSIGASKYLGSSLGISVDGGYYNHSEKQNDYQQSEGFMHITGGINYRLPDIFKPSKRFCLTTHFRGGIANWIQKSSFMGNDFKNREQSLHFNLGGSLDMRIHQNWSIRLIQAEYAPTFFFDEMQHNYRLGAGIVYSR